MSESALNIIRPNLRRPPLAHELPACVVNVGLTGGIGSGKTTVAQLLRQWGVTVIDLDAISHALTGAGGRAMPEIITAFGESAAQADGALNRAQMRAWVFSQPEKKQILEAIMHPMIAQDTIEQAHRCAVKTHLPFIIYDMPLLAESAYWQARLDWIVVVDCSRNTQVERVHARNPHLDYKTIDAIMSSQASAQERVNIANVLINNDKNDNNFLNLSQQIDILVKHMALLSKT